MRTTATNASKQHDKTIAIWSDALSSYAFDAHGSAAYASSPQS